MVGIKLDDKYLYDRCIEVKDFEAAKHNALLMWDLLRTYKTGVGLAANQCGLRSRIIIINCPAFKATMFNPIITKRSPQTMPSKEGCLSFDEGKTETTVRRHKRVTVHWTNERGEEKSMKLSGLDGRAVQHEIDHLNGKTIFVHDSDRMVGFRPAGCDE